MPTSNLSSRTRADRQAAVAAIVRDGRLLVIKRALTVRAPGKLCFPGGHIEQGEHAAQAVVRELREELNLAVDPVAPLWTSVARSGCHLHWLECKLTDLNSEPKPNPSEVHSCSWMTVTQLAEHPDVLASNFSFLEKVSTGEIRFVGEAPAMK